jgi:hypothetical protein
MCDRVGKVGFWLIKDYQDRGGRDQACEEEEQAKIDHHSEFG